MANKAQLFENKDFGKLRVVDTNSQPWFVGKDITDILAYQNSRDAIRVHVDAEDKATVAIHDGRQNRKMVIINESGLYSLILSSRLPTAKAFKRWVTSEVLPSVRRHGAYITDSALDELSSSPESAAALLETLKAEREKKVALLNYIESIDPKVRYCDLILLCENAIPVSVIAKDYGMTAIDFNKLLNGLGIQFNVGGTWLLYRRHSNHGYTITRTFHVNDTTADIRTYWTQKGRYFLYEALKRSGILPEAEKGGSQWLM